MRKMCYNNGMHNWSVDEEALKKYPEKYMIWKLEQMVNFGLCEGKINKQQLLCFWPRLHLDPSRRRYLHFLLHDRISSH